MALNATAELAGFSPAPEGRATYAAVMDWTLERGRATLFALEDGTGSLYLSTGGGVIGGGFHDPVRVALDAFVRAFDPFLETMTGDLDGLPPPRGRRISAL